MKKMIYKHMPRRSSMLIVWLLVGVILASPLTDDHPRIGVLLALVSLATVLLGAVSEGNRKIVLIVGIPVVVVWCFARLMETIGSEQTLFNHAAHALGLLLSCTLIWALTDRMRHTSEITKHVIAEAAMIYLVVAVAFSQFYWIINGLVPHCFNQVVLPSQSSALMYFSMVTLTGLGDGALAPVNPFIRLVAGFESMAGVFYIAVVVSRLVSSYIPQVKAD